jgi:hypothetical protein
MVTWHERDSMRGFHFSLRSIFVLVSFLAVGCGLQIYASHLSASLTFTAVLAVLLAAVPGAICHTGERRAFWAGFAAMGFVHLWLVCGSWLSPDGTGPLRDRLLTTTALHWCHEKVARTQPASVVMTGGMGMSPGGGMVGSMTSMGGGSMMMPGGMGGMPPMMAVVTPDWSDFITTGQSLLTLAFAVLGGLIGRCSHRLAQTAAPTR